MPKNSFKLIRPPAFGSLASWCVVSSLRFSKWSQGVLNLVLSIYGLYPPYMVFVMYLGLVLIELPVDPSIFFDFLCYGLLKVPPPPPPYFLIFVDFAGKFLLSKYELSESESELKFNRFFITLLVFIILIILCFLSDFCANNSFFCLNKSTFSSFFYVRSSIAFNVFFNLGKSGHL